MVYGKIPPILVSESDRMLLRVYQVLLYLIQPLIWIRLLLRSRKALRIANAGGTLWFLWW